MAGVKGMKTGFSFDREAAIAAGKIGGKAKNKNKGFGSRKDLAAKSGEKGGRISRRSKNEN